MKKNKKIFAILAMLIIAFSFLYEAGHTYMVSGYGHSDNLWSEMDDKQGYILNDFLLELNKGEYALSFEYQNELNQDIEFQILDREHNDGNNHLGVVIKKVVLKPGTHSKTLQFEVKRDSHNIQIFTEQQFPMYDWKIRLINDSYTDGIFLCLFLIGILYLLYFKVNWKKPQPSAILCGAGIFITLPFVGGILQSGHDLPFHISRIKGVAEALSGEQFPVRMNVDINQGYGFVSEILYPDLFVYLPALLVLLGMSVMAAYKYWILLINIATALVGYYSFSKLLKSKNLGLLCALMYLVNPYRLNNIFLRASIGEVLAEIFLPLLIYALVEVLYGNYKKWWLLVIAATGIMQSHVLTLEMSILFTVLFCLISLKFIMKHEAGKRIVSCLKAAVMVVGVNLWFLIPFLDHLKYRYFLVCDKRDVSRDTVYLFQMFLSRFQVSGANIMDGLTGEMPLTIGIVMLFGSACYMYYAYGLKMISGRMKQIGDISLIFGGISCYMASEYFPWEFLRKHCSIAYELLAKMQYPWRMLGFAGLFLSIVTTIALSAMWRDKKPVLVYGAGAGVILLMLQCMDGYLGNNPETVLTSRNQDGITATYIDYYYDKDVGELDQGYFAEVGERVITDSDVEITDFKKQGVNLEFHFTRLNSKRSVFMRMPLYHYSLHKAYLNGKELEIQTGGPGMIMVEVPAGVEEGDIEVVYTERKLYQVGDLGSLVILVGIGGYVCWKKRKKKE